MFVENVVYQFLQVIKARLPMFQYLPRELWSPDTDFDSRLADYVVKIDQEEGLSLKEHLGMVWTLSRPLSNSQVLGRPKLLATYDTNTVTGRKIDYVEKEASYEIGVFSNEPYELIKFMEYFVVEFDNTTVMQVNFPDPFNILVGGVTINLRNIELTEFTKLDRDSRGSLTKLGLTFSCNVPIGKPRPVEKLIGVDPSPVYDPTKVVPKIYINQNVPQPYLDDLYAVCPNFIMI